MSMHLLLTTPISEDQELQQADEGDLLTANVPDDQQTLWWIQSYNAAIDVH
ncbi:hypothetical protein [Maribrevibacterium harenarium]|uniref:hypothetical protein n=1 Tax=Maribrevibacterium harenarium TaxID=2589817 RepID=UPI0015E3C0AC|nr:hypothetical protein [Maribrevibacterium harenarium]